MMIYMMQIPIEDIQTTVYSTSTNMQWYKWDTRNSPH